jgi:putative superfamily III holin-X
LPGLIPAASIPVRWEKLGSPPFTIPTLRRPRVGTTEGHKCPLGAGYAPEMFGLLARAKAVKKRTLSLAQLNLELAKLEGKQKATEIGIGAGLGAVAGVLVVYGIGFAFAAAAAGLSEAISLWLSLLIVAGILLGLAAIAGFLAMRFVKKASPPTPTQALEEASRTLETFEGHV